MGQSRYPLDFEALEKGTTITVEQLENIFGVKRDDRMYSVRVMALCNEIEKYGVESRTNLHTKSDRGAIRILTDEEDAEYQAKRFKEGLDQAFRSQHKALVIDVDNLSDVRKIAHERNLQKQSFILASILKARKEIKSHERSGNVLGIQSEDHGNRALANALAAGSKPAEPVGSEDAGDQQQAQKK